MVRISLQLKFDRDQIYHEFLIHYSNVKIWHLEFKNRDYLLQEMKKLAPYTKKYAFFCVLHKYDHNGARILSNSDAHG